MKVDFKFFRTAATATCIAAIVAFAQEAQEKTINGIECVLVKAGTFIMGSPTSDPDRNSDETQHQVTITRDYWVSKYPVTQAQYKAAMGSNPSHSDYGIGDNYPVNMVSWDESVAFCNAVGGRLLTEAEWEFAARGGNKSKGYIYSGSNNLDEVGWYWRDEFLTKNYGNSGYGVQPVGTKSPNELGIYDMSGNVWEWCSNWSGDYSISSQTDPTGPSSGSRRVYRGGGWCNVSYACRVAFRYCNSPSYSREDLGLRVAFDLAATPIRDIQKSDDKHGILLKENIVSDKAEFEVVLPNKESVLEIKIVIYDNTGNVVFEKTQREAKFSWNLTNNAGRAVANGTYLIIAEAKGAKGNYAYSAKVGVKR